MFRISVRVWVVVHVRGFDTHSRLSPATRKWQFGGEPANVRARIHGTPISWTYAAWLPSPISFFHDPANALSGGSGSGGGMALEARLSGHTTTGFAGTAGFAGVVGGVAGGVVGGVVGGRACASAAETAFAAAALFSAEICSPISSLICALGNLKPPFGVISSDDAPNWRPFVGVCVASSWRYLLAYSAASSGVDGFEIRRPGRCERIARPSRQRETEQGACW